MDTIKVLGKGFVNLVDFMGGDNAVVRAARVSFGEGSKGEEKDRKLIHYLMKHKHGTPFEHSVFTFHVKAPIFVARQWFRHRIGSFNEISARYTKVEDEFYIPPYFRKQHEKNKQASKDIPVENSEQLILNYEHLIENIFDFYNTLLDKGVAREQARLILPMATYTQFYWTVNARSLMNFISLRLDSHAQKEIQEYAYAVAFFFAMKMPITFEAFIEHGYEGDMKDELQKIRAIASIIKSPSLGQPA